MNLILRLDIPDFAMHCRMLTAFMKDHGLPTQDCHAILLMESKGDSPESIAKQVAAMDFSVLPAKTATVLCTPHYRMEEVLATIPKEDLTLLPGSYFGDALAVRLGAYWGGCSMTDVVTLQADAEHSLVVQRSLYTNHMMGTFRLHQGPFVLAIDRNYGEAECHESTEILDVQILKEEGTTFHRVEEADAPSQGLTDAAFVIACGRGIRNTSNAEYAMTTGQRLGASVGGTRPVVLNGWMPMDHLIGVSRNMIHPKVCLVLAASGSPAFYAGIEKSTRILAVNKDSRAPIFRKADVCIEADWKDVLSRLATRIDED